MRTMKCMNWATLIAFASIGLMLPSLAIAEIEGLIEIDYPDAGEPKVEVNLAGTLFSLAAKAMRDEDPETSEFLANLKAIRVRIYDEAALGGKSFGEILKFYKQQLQKSEWEVLARVKDEESTVGVYSLTKGDVVSGLVVLIGNPKEFIIVNLAGKIDIAKLAEIDEITGVDLHLSDLNIKKKLTPEKEKKQKEQRENALKSFWDGKPDRAIAFLEELEREDISNYSDYALMAMLYNSTGAVDKSSHYLGKLRELEDFHTEYALMAVLHHSTGALDKSYYYLGRLYESENLKDISAAFYKKAVEINPQSEAAKRLSGE